MLIFICLVSRTSTQFYFIFHAVLKVFWISVSVELYSVGKIRTDVKNRVFPIPIAYWSGFGIFKQNWENATKLG